MKFKPIVFILSLIYGAGYAIFCYKYIPHIPQFQLWFFPLIILLIIITGMSIRNGTLTLIFFIPILGSSSIFFQVQDINALLFVFYGFFLGVLINQVFHPANFILKDPIWMPIGVCVFVVVISALITVWRYSNFFPFLDSSINELIINNINVKAGEAFRRVIFDFLTFLMAFVWFGVIINVIKTKKMIQKSIIVLASSSALSFCFGIYQFLKNPELGNTPYWIRLNRINALFSDPNAFGIYLVISIPTFLGALIVFKKWRPLFIFSLATGICLLFQTGSRSGFLGILLAFGIFSIISGKIIFSKRKSGSRFKKKLLLFIVTPLIIIGILFSSYFLLKESTLYKRIQRDVTIIISRVNQTNILGPRKFFWQAAYHMVKEFPLSGIGIGAFTCELPNYYQKYDILPHNTHWVKTVPIDSAGNYYLQIASELGLVGLFLIGWILLLILKHIYTANFKLDIETRWRYFIAAFSAVIISMLFISFFGAHTLSVEVQLIFWLVIGILITLVPPNKKSPKFKTMKKVFFVVLIIIFTFSYTWNCFHALSLQNRTSTFNLVQNFGFYQKEEMNGRRFRWTGKNAGINITIKDSVLVIPLLASHPDIQNRSVQVKIFITKKLFKNKRLLDKVIIKRNDWQDYRYDVSDEIGNDVLLLFKISRTWKPLKMLGTPDSRDIGIAVGELRFE